MIIHLDGEGAGRWDNFRDRLVPPSFRLREDYQLFADPKLFAAALEATRATIVLLHENDRETTQAQKDLGAWLRNDLRRRLILYSGSTTWGSRFLQFRHHTPPCRQVVSLRALAQSLGRDAIR